MARSRHFRVLISAFLAAALACVSCGRGRSGPEPVTTDEILRHISYLSDDLLEGRAVGSRGLELAAGYQEDFFRTFGLEPAFGSSYRQNFLLRGARPDGRAALQVSSKSAVLTPALFQDFVVGTRRQGVPAEVAGELVYCGYMIQAPERGWDDIKGADLKGKVLLCEINEPGNFPGGVFDGEDMTYYGRWVHKFEKADELGAAGVLIIHDDKGAAYGWDVVRNGWSKERFFLPDREPRLGFEGWVSGPLAEEVFKAAGLDRRAMLRRAEAPDFTPVATGLTVSVRQKPSFRTVEAANLAGIVRAGHRKARGRVIIVSAHYDHLGTDPLVEGDHVYNGAVDNCSASAAMLALASYYARRPDSLRDDVCFAAVTAEEEGLLGSDYFARHLPFPADRVMADINFEMTNVWGETEDVFAVGADHSELEDVCRAAAEKMGLRYIPERNRELGFFFRSDQFSFVRAGIPAVWLHQGVVSRGADKDFVKRKFEEYQRAKYHKVTDEIEPDWDLRGTLQVIDWARTIIELLSEREEPPAFRPSSPFKRK